MSTSRRVFAGFIVTTMLKMYGLFLRTISAAYLESNEQFTKIPTRISELETLARRISITKQRRKGQPKFINSATVGRRIRELTLQNCGP